MSKKKVYKQQTERNPGRGYACKLPNTQINHIHKENINPVCAVSDTCGACSCIEQSYQEQLVKKQRFVADLFDDIIRSSKAQLDPIIGMDHPFEFRNKIASPFAPARKGRKGGSEPDKRAVSKRESSKRLGKKRTSSIAYGMYALGTHRIVQTDVCPVEHPVGRSIVKAVAQLMAKWDITPYHEDSGSGFLRHVVVRVGHESGEVLVTLVTNEETFPSGKQFARALVKRCPSITTVVQNINTRMTNAILGHDERVLYGPGFILDTLCGLSFRISSHSFYQVNAVQTEVLYRLAIDMATLSDKRAFTILDAYCGTGTIGLVAAAHAQHAQVIGVDSVESAIRDARENARHNGIQNARFVCEDATSYIRWLAREQVRVEVVMMDPPRAGSTPECIEAIGALNPDVVVYISCNPETQVRDLYEFKRSGYHLQRLQAVDMFPHTEHVECVCLMTRV